MARKKKTAQPVKVGVIGCGNISGIYFKNMCGVFENLEVVACADLDMERARAAAEEYDTVRPSTVEELLGDESIEIVVNLTIPRVHAEVAAQCLQAGKHTHGEKPLAVTYADGKKILDTAKRKNLRVGSAPDTFLGAGIQTARKLLDEGMIGEPVAATAFCCGHGHEGWHPDPEFYYDIGGGPMLDMGPYYLTALVSLLGPARRVCGSTRASLSERTITSAKKYGKKIKVKTPTHLAGTVDFAQGAVCTIVTSFDMWKHNLPRIEIYGSEGSMVVPDPNGFGGPVQVYTRKFTDWCTASHTHGYAENSRGIGVADMAAAIASGRPHRCSGEMAMHVLEIMTAFEKASSASKYVQLKSSCERPAPLPTGLRPGAIDT